ncbi:MAG: hypothetical protein R3315_12140 [Woeseiaceae bacterium]|nr:hypothetical protein [Woeseiaceae bacterium]
MKKTVTSLVLAGMLFATHAAAANDHNDRVRAWIAESIEWRLSFLPKVYQKTDVIDTADGSMEGAAALTRTQNGIRGSIATQVDDAGAPYTLWIMVINNPGACTSTPCGLGDLFDASGVPLPGPELSIYNGGGEFSASDGNGGGVVDIDFETTAGPLPGGLFDLLGNGIGLRRGNGFDAEIWLVVDSHDPLIDTSGSWVTDLTETDGDPARNHRIAFLPAE